MTALKAQKKCAYFIKNPSFPVSPDSDPLKIQYKGDLKLEVSFIKIISRTFIFYLPVMKLINQISV